jgi:ribosomal protein S21
MIEVKKREGEQSSALMFRFTRKVKRSGVLKEVNSRRFKSRPVSRIKRRKSAIYKGAKKKELARTKQLGA